VSERGMSQVNGYWKWVAAILISIMLAGSPAIILAIQAPTSEEVNIIRERQNQVLQRLAVLEERVETNQVLIIELQQLLREHEQKGG
jgi:uncharacterized protein YpmS